MKKLFKLKKNELCFIAILTALFLGVRFWNSCDYECNDLRATVLAGIIISFFIIFELKNQNEITYIILISLFLRFGLLLLVAFSQNVDFIPYSNKYLDDFYLKSLEVLYDRQVKIDAYFVSNIYAVILFFLGNNCIFIRLINLLLSICSIKYIYRTARILELRADISKNVIFVVSFLPVNILLSISVVRESSISFLITISMFFLISYYQRKKWYMLLGAFISLLIATLLHSSAIVILFVYIFAVLFWNPDKDKFCMTFKNICAVLSVSIIFIIILISPLQKYILAYLPSKPSDIFLIIENRMSIEGNGNYLGNFVPTNFFQFFCGIPIRMIYFLFSPLPSNWNRWIDVIAFIGDSFFYIFSVVCSIINLFKKNIYKLFAIINICSIILFSAINAWGVRNSGTAMRHRSKLFCFCVFSIIIAFTNFKLIKDKDIDNINQS